MMRIVRLAVGAALVAGAVPLATASHARCTEPASYVCSAAYLACTTARDATTVGSKVIDCPQY